MHTIALDTDTLGSVAPTATPTTTETVVLDTCVLIADPEALHAFGELNIVLPLTVIEELDNLKTRPDDVGRNARTVLRAIEELRVDNDGNIADAVDLPGGGTLRIEPNGLRLDSLEAFHLDASVPDNRILAAALGLAEDGLKVTVVSNDAAVRIKADVLGLAARDYARTRGAMHTVTNPGWHTIEVDPSTVDAIYEHKRLSLADLHPHEMERFGRVLGNEFVIAHAEKQSALVRLIGDELVLLPTGKNKDTAWGLGSKSKEQAFALNLLLDRDVPIVALSGKAGTGKTILAIAAGLQQTFEVGGCYTRMTILRPIISVGKADLGFLPGDVEAKLGPWFEAVVDAMVALSTTGQSHKDCKAQLDAWVADGRLTLEAVTYLRGRSLQGTYVIVDEAQNLEPSTIKTILTRLGKGSKAVLCGDVEQIDNPYLAANSNGLAVLADAFAGEPLFGQIVLQKGERSAVADLAAARL